MRALPEHFQGNSLALLQAVYRDTSQELRVRIDAAGRALPYEMSRPQSKTVAPDLVPLHERIKEYAREKAIQASDGKVVEIDQRR